MSQRVILMAGTVKGLFLFESDMERKKWQVRGPFLNGWEVYSVLGDNRHGARIFAGTSHMAYGPSLRVSEDFGENWTEIERGPSYPTETGFKLNRFWQIVPGHASQPDTLYAGAEEAGIFVSRDRGESWTELDALTKALLSPARPMVAIVGGSKVSTKLTVLESLSEKVDQLVVGGGIANTFLKACGNNIGKSLSEDDLVPTAKTLMEKMSKRGASIPIAVYVVVGKKFDANEPAVLKEANQVAEDEMIFDIGPKSAQELVDIIMKAGTVVWNGPVGVFEFDQFGAGTQAIAMAIAETKAFTLAGGGDTIAAIQKYDIYDKVSYISTAGGAFLEFLEGKTLPAVAILEQRAAS